MGLLDASPAVLVLGAIDLAIAVYAVRCHLLADRVADRIVAHVEREHPGSLDAIPWFWRRFARSSVKIAVLHRTVPAALPQDDLAEMWRLERRMLVGLVLFFGVLFMLLAGSRAFQWRWG